MQLGENRKMAISIMVIDDERDFLESVRRGLVTAGIKNVRIEADPQIAAALFQQGHQFDIALIDVTMPEMDGIELLEIIKTTSPATECIMVTAVDAARTAIQCLKKGAYDYLVKPTSKEDLVSSVDRALERKRLIEILDLGKRRTLPEIINKKSFSPIVTGSNAVLRVLKEAELHAASDIPVLITGETGTGKELLSKAIHAASSRAGSVFTPVNMESLNSNMFDAQFFGHTRGAYTGADRDGAGYLETSNGGTLFLDEIGNLPLELQGKLLRVLQEGEFIKIGTAAPRKVDVRFIAATNSDLERMMVQKKFRMDLYYRLKGGWLALPPLRERKEDIPLLVRGFIEEFCGSSGTDVEEAALSLLMDYDYPGNIRELKAIIQAAVNLAQGQPISVKFLPPQLVKKKKVATAAHTPNYDTIATLEQVEKEHILSVYNLMDKNKSGTARSLGIGLNTLRRKLESYGAA
jgi:two-component system response regulator AtoC